MDTADLKEYVRQCKDIETRLYTNRLLIDSQDGKFHELLPGEPIEPKYETCYKPICIVSKEDINKRYLYIALGIFVFIIGIILFNKAINYEVNEIIAALTLAVGSMFTVFHLSEMFKDKKLISKYNMEMDYYKKNHSRIEEENRKLKEEYEQYSINYRNIKEKLTLDFRRYNLDLLAVDKKLSETLKELYNQGYIFPKYRNLVAITSICEYLESGRVDKLEGPDGAYNLYENELRQNTIVGILSDIITNLENIKNNQYSLYQSLTESQSIVNTTLKSIEDNQSISTYCNEAIAGNTAAIAYLESQKKE